MEVIHKHELYIAALGCAESAPDVGCACLSRVGDEPKLYFGDFKFLGDGHINLTRRAQKEETSCAHSQWLHRVCMSFLGPTPESHLAALASARWER